VGRIEIAPMAWLRREHKWLIEADKELLQLSSRISQLQKDMFEMGAFRHRERVQDLHCYQEQLKEECRHRRENVRREAEVLETGNGVALWPALVLSCPGDAVSVTIQGDSSALFYAPVQTGRGGEEEGMEGGRGGGRGQSSLARLYSFFSGSGSATSDG